MSRDEPAVDDDMNAVTSVEIDLELKRRGNCAHFGANVRSCETSFTLNVGTERTSRGVSAKFEFVRKKTHGCAKAGEGPHTAPELVSENDERARI